MSFDRFLAPIYLPRWLHKPILYVKRAYILPTPPPHESSPTGRRDIFPCMNGPVE
jgi:hypothetical protein